MGCEGGEDSERNGSEFGGAQEEVGGELRRLTAAAESSGLTSSSSL